MGVAPLHHGVGDFQALVGRDLLRCPVADGDPVEAARVHDVLYTGGIFGFAGGGVLVAELPVGGLLGLGPGVGFAPDVFAARVADGLHVGRRLGDVLRGELEAVRVQAGDVEPGEAGFLRAAGVEVVVQREQHVPGGHARAVLERGGIARQVGHRVVFGGDGDAVRVGDDGFFGDFVGEVFKIRKWLGQRGNGRKGRQQQNQHGNQHPFQHGVFLLRFAVSIFSITQNGRKVKWGYGAKWGLCCEFRPFLGRSWGCDG